jgi:hypothetical protein
MWKRYINIVLGGLSIVLIIGGLLWFFSEMSPEPALAFVTGLVTLFGWFQTREDKREQEKDLQDRKKESNKLYKASSSNAIWVRNQTHEKIDNSEESIKQHVTNEVQRSTEQGERSFVALDKALTSLNENVNDAAEINLIKHDETRIGLQELQSGIGQVSQDVQNLPQRMKEQELIERLITAADNFEYRFRHTYAEDQLGALQGARIDFDKLRVLAKFLLQDDFSEIYDVFHSCCMELAFAIKGLAKSPIPPASEEKWNSVCCGPRRKELDAELKGAYDNLQKKLHRDNA